MFTLNEDKYVGTLMRDHNKYHQALLLVGVFNMKTLLFDNVFDIDKKKAKLEKKSKKVSIFRLSNVKDVEKTIITSSSFTHVSNKEMIYANMYVPDERVAEYQSYSDAMTKVDDLMEWYSETSSDVSDSEVFINAIEYNNNVIEYNLSPQDVQTEERPIYTFHDAIHAPVKMYEDTAADYEVYQFTKLFTTNDEEFERCNDDTNKIILQLNKEAEDELAELIDIKVPETNNEKKHAIIRKYKTYKISHRDAEDQMYDITKTNQTTQQYRFVSNPNVEKQPREIIIKCETIEDNKMRLSRCSTLRKIQVKRENVSTKNAIIKLYKENEITYDEAVIKINEYKKK